MGGSIQGTELSLSTAVTTLAGTGSSGSANGTGTSASFYKPYGVTTDGTNLYVTDTWNHLVRKIVISTGAVTTLAGTGSTGSANGTGTSASFNYPAGITTDGTNLYVADSSNHLIRKIVISTGAVTTVAGTGSSGSANGTGTSASFNYPEEITTDGTNLYVADTFNHLIRKIVISTGVVTTVAGTGSSGSANGTGTSASFNSPHGITTDGTNLYVAEYGNHLIRQIVISTGVVTTVAGTGSSGSANGTGTSASFYSPRAITTDGTNLYVAEYGNHLIRKIVISTGVVTTVAGTGSSGSANGTGTSASFNSPHGITTDGTNLYVAEYGNHLIRKIE
jgi:DNA-binding beta-propeller fold protein YncE